MSADEMKSFGCCGVGNRLKTTVDIETKKGIVPAGSVVVPIWAGYEAVSVYYKPLKVNFYVTPETAIKEYAA